MSLRGSKLYDLTELIDMYSGNMDNVRKTIHIFCDQMRKDNEMLKSRFEEGDLLSVKAFAHRMKPNLKLFGITEMHQLVVDIEQTSAAGDKTAVKHQLEHLYQLTDLVCDALSQFLKT